MVQKSRKHMSVLTESLLKIVADPNVQAEIPDIDNYVNSLTGSLRKSDQSSLESNLLKLYERLHRAGSVYSTDERNLLIERRGYACHPGGLSPLVKAAGFVRPESIVADLGAGNGLQGLLLQCLRPHRKTIQIEISCEMIRIGRIFQRALGIGDEHIEWINDDIMNVPINTVDFVYIYLPAKPIENGVEVYKSIAKKLSATGRPLIVFSVADCLARFLGGQFSVFYTDGHLTCFARQ
jgi:hypothetical protein